MSASILDELDQLLKGEATNTSQTTKKLDPPGVKTWLAEQVSTAKNEDTQIAKARVNHAKLQLSKALKAFKGGADSFEVTLFDATKHREAQSIVADLEDLHAKLDKIGEDKPEGEQQAEAPAAENKPDPAAEVAPGAPGAPGAADSSDESSGDGVEKGWEVAPADQPWTSDMRHMRLDDQGRILHRKSIAFG